MALPPVVAFSSSPTVDVDRLLGDEASLVASPAFFLSSTQYTGRSVSLLSHCEPDMVL